jgi:hypothetical protein
VGDAIAHSRTDPNSIAVLFGIIADSRRECAGAKHASAQSGDSFPSSANGVTIQVRTAREGENIAEGMKITI